MKGEFALKILEHISEAAVGVGDLFEAFLISGYGASRGKMEYNLRMAKRHREGKSAEKLEYIRAQRRYHNILAWLKRDGLIEEKTKNDKTVFGLTGRGLRKLSFLRNRRKHSLPDVSYNIVESDNFVIIVFDVPEKERRKRAWLRSVLKNMKFKMLQKSVWLGMVKIPKSFIDDLRGLRLADCVEVFEITKTGSLRHVV